LFITTSGEQYKLAPLINFLFSFFSSSSFSSISVGSLLFEYVIIFLFFENIFEHPKSINLLSYLFISSKNSFVDF
jgi:hypothetical protein